MSWAWWQVAGVFLLGAWLGAFFGYLLACLMMAAKRGEGG